MGIAARGAAVAARLTASRPKAGLLAARLPPGARQHHASHTHYSGSRYRGCGGRRK
jgi:hypothetical protein